MNPHNPRDWPTARARSFPPPPPGGVSTGAERRYLLSAEIGSDSCSTVHLAKLRGPASFERIVAVRRLRPRLAKDAGCVARVLDGARFAASVRHANVLPTLDVVTGDEVLVVTEYVAGESLAALLLSQRDRGTQTPPAVASGIVVGMLRGLQAVHEGRAAHPVGDHRAGEYRRVPAPEDVRVGTDGVARLIDVDGRAGAGIPDDVAAGDDRGDVFGASMVLWEALAGRPPPAQTAEGFEPPSKYREGLDPAIDLLVSKGLAPAPAFASAADMAAALEATLPPAAPSQIGAWVESLAREALAERERLVAKFEQADPAAIPVSQRVAVSGREDVGERVGSLRPDRRKVVMAAVAATVILAIACVWYADGNRSAPVATPPRTTLRAPVTPGAVADDSSPPADTGGPRRDEPSPPPEQRKAQTSVAVPPSSAPALRPAGRAADLGPHAPKPRPSAPLTPDDVL